MFEEEAEDSRSYDSDYLTGHNEDQNDNVLHESAEQEKSAEQENEDNSIETVRVPIDWVEFEGALENNSPELKSYLNLFSGDVIRVFDGSDKLKEISSDTNEEYVLIDPISSREQYCWMEEFIEIVEDASLKDKLNIAIDGKGAFRRFKDVLMAYPVEREKWFTKRSSKLYAHMIEWLKKKHIEPANIPPWDEAYDHNKRFEEKKQRGEAESKPSWREGQMDLRAVGHDLLDLIPSRELPTAVAFLEFLKGRRGNKRPNYM